MDYFGANSEGEWSSLSGVYTAEEADFMAQLLGGCSFPSNQPDGFRAQSTPEESLSFSFDSNELLRVSDHNKENYYFDPNTGSMPMEICIGDYVNKETVSDENPRKRARESSDHHVEAKKRNVKAKAARKTQKVVQSASNDEDGNAVSSSCSDNNDNRELSSSLTLGSKGKVRASRGSATDPQSLYARKRRERINERLRILQSLVPNGTKVDISTMLEEAVEYVKFLQLQIKLLSSDDLWMYSPIAYNGMDLGLNITVPQSRPA